MDWDDRYPTGSKPIKGLDVFKQEEQRIEEIKLRTRIYCKKEWMQMRTDMDYLLDVIGRKNAQLEANNDFAVEEIAEASRQVQASDKLYREQCKTIEKLTSILKMALECDEYNDHSSGIWQIEARKFIKTRKFFNLPNPD